MQDSDNAIEQEPALSMDLSGWWLAERRSSFRVTSAALSRPLSQARLWGWRPRDSRAGPGWTPPSAALSVRKSAASRLPTQERVLLSGSNHKTRLLLS